MPTILNPLRVGSTTGPLIYSGSGSPESVFTAPIGSLYLRTDGSTDTAVYRKESGTGNTGWVAVAAGGSGSIVTLSDTAPSFPSAYAFWLRTTDGALFVQWNDGSSTQWVGLSGPKGDPGDDAIGKQTMWIPASGMISRSTNGPAGGSFETTTNKVMAVTLDFDTTTQEFAQFTVAFPKGWNEGTVTFQFFWCHASTTTNFGVVFGLEAVALANDDPLESAFGTAITVADTGGTTDDVYVSPESNPVTIAGSPGVDELVVFQIKRVPSDGSDNLAVDARLLGIKLFFTTDAATDA